MGDCWVAGHNSGPSVPLGIDDNTAKRRHQNPVSSCGRPPDSGFGSRCVTYLISSTLSRIARASASLSRGTRTLHQPRKFPLSWRAPGFLVHVEERYAGFPNRLFAKPIAIGLVKPVRMRTFRSFSRDIAPLLPGSWQRGLPVPFSSTLAHVIMPLASPTCQAGTAGT